MITIAFEFKTLSEAHAALGMLMATQQAAAAPAKTVPEATENAEAPPKKKRGRPAATVFSIEEVEELKQEFAEFTKTQGFLPAKNLLKQFKVPRFSALTSKQHQPFATAMRAAA